MRDALRVVVVEDEAPQRQQLIDVARGHSGRDRRGRSGRRRVRGATDRQRAARISCSSTSRFPSSRGSRRCSAFATIRTIVFTTAYRDFAIDAFELGAIDYLLKPFGQSRVNEAIARVRERLVDTRVPMELITDRMRAVEDAGAPLARIYVRERNAIVPVPVDDIVRLEADGDYTAVLTSTRRHLVALPLKTLHERIRRPDFVRIHRQHVVNMAHVIRIEPYDAARLVVHLAPGGKIVASRGGSQVLRQLRQGLGIRG